jgi:hypothetical protein
MRLGGGAPAGSVDEFEISPALLPGADESARLRSRADNAQNKWFPEQWEGNSFVGRA